MFYYYQYFEYFSNRAKHIKWIHMSIKILVKQENFNLNIDKLNEI